MHGDSFHLCISFDSKPLPLVELKGNEHSHRSHRFTPQNNKNIITIFRLQKDEIIIINLNENMFEIM